MAFNLITFSNTEELNRAMADSVCEQLNHVLQTQEQATLAVSGGSTPGPFFLELSQRDINWQNITITLADERCVSPDSPDSNTHLVQNKLRQNNAQAAAFFPLVTEKNLVPNTKALESEFRSQASLPLSMTILGMGNDGHTASLFPCAPTINALIKDSGEALFHFVEPSTAPYTRITFSLPTLLQSQKIFLHLVGKQKYQVLEKAITGKDSLEMPIRAFLHHPDVSIDIYWAPNQGDTL